MRLLLDTHCFLWWISEPDLVSTMAQELIADGSNRLYWSAASSWEVAIKYQLGKLPMVEPPETFIPAQLLLNRCESLHITDAHAFRAAQLPRHHSDPFDRMLVAQAQHESLILLSQDAMLQRYDIDIRW